MNVCLQYANKCYWKKKKAAVIKYFVVFSCLTSDCDSIFLELLCSSMKMHKKQENGRKEAAEEQHVKGKARGGCVSLANNEGQ